MWVLLRLSDDPDYNGVSILPDAKIEEILANPTEWGIHQFRDAAWLQAHPHPQPWENNNGWTMRDAVLLRAEVVVPKPVTTVTKWELS